MLVVPRGTSWPTPWLWRHTRCGAFLKGAVMDSIIYLVGLVVVVLAILSFLGLR